MASKKLQYSSTPKENSRFRFYLLIYKLKILSRKQYWDIESRRLDEEFKLK